MRPLQRRGLSRDGRIALFLVLSALPAGIIALVFEDVLLRVAEEIWVIAVMLIVFGLVLLLADRLGGHRQVEDFGGRDAVIMGAGQALALIPGVSRSGGAMTAGRVVAFERAAVARLAFLMSLPIILGAAVVRGLLLAAGDGIPHRAGRRIRRGRRHVRRDGLGGGVVHVALVAHPIVPAVRDLPLRPWCAACWYCWAVASAEGAAARRRRCRSAGPGRSTSGTT